MAKNYWGERNQPYILIKRYDNELTSDEQRDMQEIYMINEALVDEIKGGVAIVFPSSTQRIGPEDFKASNMKGKIVKIGEKAFSRCDSLEIVRFPSNLVGIATSAFFGCGKLTSVQFNDKLVKIGDGAFSDCPSLGRVNIPDSVTFIGNGVFYGCIGLVEATLGEGVKELREKVFSGCSKLERVKLSDKLETFGVESFSGCSSLKKIKIPTKTHTISSKAFYNCIELMDVEIDKDLSNLIIIEDSAFENCHSLTSISLPDTVESMGNSAFKGCTNLTNVTLSEKLTYLGMRVFENCSSLKNVTISPNIRMIDAGTFKGCSNLETISLSEKLEEIQGEAFMNCTSLDNVTLPDGLSYIGNGAFYGCKSLKKIVIHENVNYIGKTIWNSNKEVFGPFEDCSSLESVIIDSKIETLEKDTFKNCTSLKEVKLPDTLTYIQGYAFENCSSLDTISLPDSLRWIGMGSFKGCTGLVSVTFPQNLESIGRESFLGATSLTDIVVPSSVKKIGKNAFKDCTNLKSIILQEGLEIIGEEAFAGLTSLTEITIPSSVKKIEKNAFKGCTNLKTITLQEGLKIIGEEAFAGLTSLTEITIPSSVKKIEKNAFKDCTNLKSIILQEGLEVINEGAFAGLTSLIEITIPSSVRSLDGMFIPLSEESIGNAAFNGCTSLKKVVLSDKLEFISNGMFKGCSSLKNISFPDNLTKIKKAAFCNCNTLTKVFIPDQVSELWSFAFSGCKNLRKVRLPKNINHYGREVFKDCPLNDLTIYTNNGKGILSSIFSDISKEYVNYIDKFRLNIIYDNYKDLVEFLNSSYEFLRNNYYTKNSKLKINLVGVELSRWQKFLLNGKYPKIMSIVSLKSLEAFDIIEKESWKEDEIYILPKITYYRDEVKDSLLEMETNIKDLPDEIKELFYVERDRMIQKYEESVSVSDISFSEDEKEINPFEKTRDSLAQDLLTGLDKLKKKSNSSMISKYIEIIRCIDLLDTVVENQPDNSDSIEELVGHIVYFITKFSKDKRDEFIKQTKRILLEKKSLFLDGVTKTITNDESFNSVDEVIWGIELEKNIREVLSSVLVYKEKVDPYLELLKALECPEVVWSVELEKKLSTISSVEIMSRLTSDSYSKLLTPLEGNDILLQIMLVKYFAKFILVDSIKQEVFSLIDIFCNKYMEKISMILNDFDSIKDDDFEKLELEMIGEVQPIFQKLQKASNIYDILNELNNSLSILNDDSIVPLSDNLSIYGRIGKIHNRVVSNDYVSVNTKKMIKEKLLTVVRMWIDKINKLEEVDEKERIKIIKKIYSEINSFITTINNYLDSIIEASQYLSVVEGVSGPGSKKS